MINPRCAAAHIVKLTLLLALNSCSYRFSNLYYEAPEGIRSIGVEGIYDTSQKFAHHGIIWKELQAAIIRSGMVELAPVERADAIMRAEIRRVNRDPFGSDKKRPNVIKDDPLAESKVTKFDEERDLRRPESYESLHRATNHARNERVSLQLVIEIWNRHSQKLLSQQTHTLTTILPLITPGVPLKGQYLQSRENTEIALRQEASVLAQQVVRDFLSTN